MSTAGVHIKGLDEVLRMLNVNPRPVLAATTFAVSEQVRGVLTPYPAQPAPANPRRWYERGYGPRWRRQDGSMGGRKTSEQLGQTWATERQGLDAALGTRVSYAPWVQSEEHQAAVHQRTGWKTDEQAVNEVLDSGVVEEMLLDAIMHEMGF